MRARPHSARANAHKDPAGLKIGVISDTHNLFDPKLPSRFCGVDHILHAGDIGLPRILYQLEEIAPVTAVAGNTDDPGFHWALVEALELGGRKFLVHHIVDPQSPAESLSQKIARERPDVVVFGHTHKPYSETLDGILFFNPGYAGPPRFGLPRSVAVLHCSLASLRAEYFPL